MPRLNATCTETRIRTPPKLSIKAVRCPCRIHLCVLPCSIPDATRKTPAGFCPSIGLPDFRACIALVVCVQRRYAIPSSRHLGQSMRVRWSHAAPLCRRLIRRYRHLHRGTTPSSADAITARVLTHFSISCSFCRTMRIMGAWVVNKRPTGISARTCLPSSSLRRCRCVAAPDCMRVGVGGPISRRLSPLNTRPLSIRPSPRESLHAAPFVSAFCCRVRRSRRSARSLRSACCSNRHPAICGCLPRVGRCAVRTCRCFRCHHLYPPPLFMRFC